MAKKNQKITVRGTQVTVFSNDEQEYISLTDIARHKDPVRTDYVIQNWLRNRNTIEVLGIWEKLNNPDFNPIEFEGFRNRAGLNSFVLTTKQWTQKTQTLGLFAKAGRYDGTFAHNDIAFEFASWISVEFKLYLLKEFQRLKDQEQKSLDWNVKRSLTKINYHLHTEKIIKNNKQIRTLTALRDTLLPKLMSGDIRVDIGNGEMQDFASSQGIISQHG